MSKSETKYDPLLTATSSESNAVDPFPLARVTMPLIRVMYDARLSWAERETIAYAVNACIVQWHCLMSEHQRHVQSAMGAKLPNEKLSA